MEANRPLVLLESFENLLLRCTLILHGVPCNPVQDALQNLEQRLDAELAKVREREPTPTVLKAEGGRVLRPVCQT